MILNKYVMNLYQLYKGQENEIQPKIEVNVKQITMENYQEVSKILSIKNLKNYFKKFLEEDCIGIYLEHEGKIVGYGWLKYTGRDTFYKVQHTCYLSTFYVADECRGKRLYPYMITQLIKVGSEKYQTNGPFYISAYTTNTSSLKGIEKVGFALVGTRTFIRLLKITLGKYKLGEKENV